MVAVHTASFVARETGYADRPHRMSAEHAAHVVDVLQADASARGAGTVEVTSDFTRPEPLDWAR